MVWEMAERFHAQSAVEVHITTDVAENGPVFMFDSDWNLYAEEDRRFAHLMYHFTFVELF